MRTLYHFKFSPYSRRTRLALAHKQLDVELRDARENPAFLDEARRLVAYRTIPVLVDDGRVMGDSGAIAHWLDAAYPQAPRLWPGGAEALDALQTVALVDVANDSLTNLGTRYYALHDSPAWGGVKQEISGRAQRALDALGERVAQLSGPTIVKSGWSAADIWLYSITAWFEGVPLRAAGNASLTQILSLGVTLPPALSRWAAQHKGREDVAAMGQA
jgi:glutathione S-transferase